jgi:hypothetical protein
MIDNTTQSYVYQAQAAARRGHAPHEIVRLLQVALVATYGAMYLIRLEVCLRYAFDIPLRDVRNIEDWQGFERSGTMNDHELDELLQPWIHGYLEHQARQP